MFSITLSACDDDPAPSSNTNEEIEAGELQAGEVQAGELQAGELQAGEVQG